MYYLGVPVALIHAVVTLALCDNFACILDNDLVGLESTIGSYTVAPISCLHDLDANVVFASRSTSLL